MHQQDDLSFPLDPMQRSAVEAGGGVAMVIGGTGTGKTRVLIGSVAYLLDSGVKPGHITCLTAQCEAAADLRHRLASHPRIRDHLHEIFVGTMPEYANFFLRRAGAEVLGRSRSYTIWDRQRAVEAVQAAWPERQKAKLRKRDISEVAETGH